MKKIILVMFILTTCIFAKQPLAIIQSVCFACHGDKMELSCYGVTQVVNTLNESDILKSLQAYKNGSKSSYGYGDVMQSQIGGLSNLEIKELSKYIPTLKQE